MPQRIDGAWRFDHGNPLAGGLRDAVVLFGDSGVNLVPGAPQPTLVGAPATGLTADGRGTSAASGTAYARLNSEYYIWAGDFTFSMLWRPTSYPGSFVCALEKTSGGSRELAVFLDNTTGNINFAQGQFFTSVGMTTGSNYRYTVSRRNNVGRTYINGVFLGEVDASMGSAQVVGSSWFLGRNESGGGNHPTAVYGDFFVWVGRGLNDDEVLRHANDPYAVLRTPRPRFLASPPPLITGAGAFTFDAVTVAGAATYTAPSTSGVPHGVLRRHRRVRQWQDVPEPLKPVVALAENYADEAEVQRAVEAALARYAAMSARASVARRERLVDDMKRLIIEAVERAAEIDDEEALIALL